MIFTKPHNSFAVTTWDDTGSCPGGGFKYSVPRLYQIGFLCIIVWNMTCDLVSYMDSYMDCYIIPGHFLWHERFMNGSQCWKKRCYVLDLFSSILQIFCDTKISKMLVARSCGRAAASQCRCNVCRVRFSAHIHQVKSSACSVWIGCVTSSLLLSFLMVCSCLWCFIL